MKKADLSKGWKFSGKSWEAVFGGESYTVVYERDKLVFITHTISVHVSEDKAKQAYKEWESDWFDTTDLQPDVQYSPLDEDDDYRYECQKLKPDSPLKVCFYLQRHNEIISFVHIAFNTTDAKENKLFLKIEAIREAGYIFDATLAEERENINLNTLGIEGAQIEVYNRTTAKEELVLKDHPHPNFQVTLKKGNHYTILIRKDGFLAKRIEAFVNVKGCVLCIDGVSELTPGVTDNISAATGLGTLLANIELQKVAVGKSFEIKNINYDYNKWNIREDAAIMDGSIPDSVRFTVPRIKKPFGGHRS